jgi:hypothetical protein
LAGHPHRVQYPAAEEEEKGRIVNIFARERKLGGTTLNLFIFAINSMIY